MNTIIFLNLHFFLDLTNTETKADLLIQVLTNTLNSLIVSFTGFGWTCTQWYNPPPRQDKRELWQIYAC